MGSIIGAGFATGQEIYLFFAKYKIYGIIGSFISSFIIAYILYLVLKNIKDEKIENYSQYINKIFNNKKFFCYLNENIITVFLLLTFYVMELGFVSLLWQQFEISKYVGMLIITFLTYIVLKGNAKNVIKVNIILVPVLIIAMLYISLKGINNFGVEKIGVELTKNNWFIGSSIIYSSYNFIMLLPLLTSLKENKIKRKESLIIAVSIFIIIAILSVLIILLLCQFDLEKVEVPIIYITNFMDIKIVILGVVLILIAIFTSLVCVGYSFLNNVSKTPKKYKRNLILICLSSFVLVEFSFSSTMQITYTFLGIIGIIQILAIILANFRKN